MAGRLTSDDTVRIEPGGSVENPGCAEHRLDHARRMANPWADLDVGSTGEPGRYRTTISDPWQLVAVPLGGIVAAIAARAMETELAQPEHRLRTMSVVFAGQVACGPVEIDVQVIRRGRSMSQCSATVRNPGAAAGLTAIAVFGGERRGFSFTDVRPPDVPGPEGVRSFRDPVPDGIDFTFPRERMPFWDEVIDGRPVLGRAPWEPFEDGPAETAVWYRPDQPPVDADGLLDRLAPVVLTDMMPSAVNQKVGPTDQIWFGPSADYTVHLFGDVRPGWLLGHSRARWAGDGYASVEMTLWDSELRTPVAYATQVMFFAFGR